MVTTGKSSIRARAGVSRAVSTEVSRRAKGRAKGRSRVAGDGMVSRERDRSDEKSVHAVTTSSGQRCGI